MFSNHAAPLEYNNDIEHINHIFRCLQNQNCIKINVFLVQGAQMTI